MAARRNYFTYCSKYASFPPWNAILFGEAGTMRKYLILVAAPLVLLAACDRGTSDTKAVAESTDSDIASVKREIQAVEQAQIDAIGTKNAASAAAVYADDAVLLVPSEPALVGQAAIAEAFKAGLDDSAYNVELVPGSKKYRIAGGADFAVTQFTAKWTYTFDGKPHTDTLQNVTVWERRGGTWRIVTDLNRVDPVAEPPVVQGGDDVIFSNPIGPGVPKPGRLDG
ncbi:SgcJ/EcaC family oxidoreductase [Altererythrobacter salegens]|uniref:SgcJ/EcaC family oxidoreductase n=1 Tax=Croceibacterium salegens TaxID=1737568 RepID=A0A6I4STH4_9SPHN|nr:nuclear transport factor 2 family protein [Croceibacterium salegens]MXO59304.1 SgcJ/EcaC family oxidoreductase [Croceibacterium salegens]